jgi:hypothetical protein
LAVVSLGLTLDMLMLTRFTTWLFCSVMVVGLSGCRATPQDSTVPPGSVPRAAPATAASDSAAASQPASKASGGSDTAGHEHAAPHGGALVELGEEFAHLELVLSASTGTLTAYALDGEAEQAVRLAHPSLEIVVMKEGAAPVTLALRPVANELTGERDGDTSQFTVTSPDLRQLTRFEGRIQIVNIRGREFREVAFRFPEGSEH